MNVKIRFIWSKLAVLWTVLLLSHTSYGQSVDETIRKLSEHGFENVSGLTDEQGCIYLIEAGAYNTPGRGVAEAVAIIAQTGLSIDKPCTLIMLSNNIPQMSLTYRPSPGDSICAMSLQSWDASYELPSGWQRARSGQVSNKSLYKVDLTIYPELYFRNYIISKVYEVVFNVSPVMEISFWPGMKLSAQVIFPLKNDYGERYRQIRPGYMSVSQSFRLPARTYMTVTVGTFNNFRWGLDVRAKHILRDERFWIDARLGYTAKGYYENWAYYHGREWVLTGSLGTHFYLPSYNTGFEIRGERYLRGEYGIRAEMMRHFRDASIGFYITKVEHAGHNGLNGGFIFHVALPPYKNKRKGFMPRIHAGDFGIRYNAGNEEIYGRSYRTEGNDNQLRENSFNPFFIKSLNQ
ncbi:MAG: hypothetical protein LBS20_12690 [Prevotella sp.]|jgi:hypothetical protein|nr:hypothetical protein [Prevotella sp.]